MSAMMAGICNAEMLNYTLDSSPVASVIDGLELSSCPSCTIVSRDVNTDDGVPSTTVSIASHLQHDGMQP